MAKLMFEKGFVGLLTSVVADIELDFPDVRSVVNEILSSLRELTIAVNRLAANSTIEANTAAGDVDEISTASSVSDVEEMHDRDDTPDVFRNSALGILQGDVQEHGHHHDHDHHDLDYGEYEEEMDYDEDEDDDDDEDDLGDSGSDDEMDEDGDDDDHVRISWDYVNDRFGPLKSSWVMTATMMATAEVNIPAMRPVIAKIWTTMRMTLRTMENLMATLLSICWRSNRWKLIKLMAPMAGQRIRIRWRREKKWTKTSLMRMNLEDSLPLQFQFWMRMNWIIPKTILMMAPISKRFVK
jgi:hypothetical protein